MVASYLPTALAPFSWLKCSTPDDREAFVLPVRNGEPCFAILLYRPPKYSTWRPRSYDAIPPMHEGRRVLFLSPGRNEARTISDAAEFNQRQLIAVKPGKRIGLWAIVVTMIWGFEETARVVIGGGAHA